MRKLLSVVLAFAVLLSLSGSAFAAWPDQYADVDTWPEWALKGERVNESKYEAWGGDLADAVWWELMIGDPPADGKQNTPRNFRPHDTITRAEYATILVRTLGLNETQGAGADWYRIAVEQLAGRGIITSEGNFNAAITRREMGDWVGRSLEWYGVDLDSRSETNFTDIGGMPEAPYIRLASKAGVIKGYPDGTFGPDRTATRAEAAAMAVRLVKQLTRNKPEVGLFEEVYRQYWQVQTMNDMEMTKGGQYTHTALMEPFASPMYLYGPEGFDDYYRWFYDIRYYSDSYRELVDIEVVPILVRDTVALIRVTYIHRRVTFEGRETYRGMDTEFVYLAKRGPNSHDEGRWVVTNMEAPTTFPSAWTPQPEEGQ